MSTSDIVMFGSCRAWTTVVTFRARTHVEQAYRQQKDISSETRGKKEGSKHLVMPL